MALATYIKTVWKNLSSPAINDTHLNKIEQGLFDVTEQAIANSSLVPTGKNIVFEDSYATETTGGAIKIRVDGTDCYITTDGSNP